MTISKSKPSIYGVTLAEAERSCAGAGFPKYRAKQLLKWLYGKHISKWEEAGNLPADFREYLTKHYALSTLKIETPQNDDIETVKFLFQTQDERLLESVLISQKDRRTVCVSTQLGCKMGCTFCASGKGAFGRNLTAGEIVEQVVWIQKKIGSAISNVVFMGMGEPLDNFEPTMKAIQILESDWGFGISARRITVSTAGITPRIVEFVERNQGRIRLSVSLHSSQEAKRNELVPINRKYSLEELVKTLHQMKKKLSRKMTFEYTLIKGENDTQEEATGLAKIANPLNAMVNIIPCNPIREMNFEAPDQERIKAFRTWLTQRGVRVTVRQTAGRGIDAACGQLRLDRESALS